MTTKAKNSATATKTHKPTNTDTRGKASSRPATPPETADRLLSLLAHLDGIRDDVAYLLADPANPWPADDLHHLDYVARRIGGILGMELPVDVSLAADVRAGCPVALALDRKRKGEPIDADLAERARLKLAEVSGRLGRWHDTGAA